MALAAKKNGGGLKYIFFDKSPFGGGDGGENKKGLGTSFHIA